MSTFHRQRPIILLPKPTKLFINSMGCRRLTSRQFWISSVLCNDRILLVAPCVRKGRLNWRLVMAVIEAQRSTVHTTRYAARVQESLYRAFVIAIALLAWVPSSSAQT